MDEGLQPSDEGHKFTTTKDRTLYWTLSLYVKKSAVEAAIGKAPSPDDLRAFRASHFESRRLSEAIDPLLNDIADRQRLGQIDDFLLDTSGRLEAEAIEIETPDYVEWSTEGSRYRAIPGGLAGRREATVRRFWYAHMNGAFSYHLTFEVEYAHTPADFLFLSLLQKVCAPKEFVAADKPAGDKSHWQATDAGSGVFPLEHLKVIAGGADATFWNFVAARFTADAGDLLQALAGRLDGATYRPDQVSLRKLVEHAPFLEIPGLDMPLSRLLFFFRDRTLFNRLLPPFDQGKDERPSRNAIVREAYYQWYPNEIGRLSKATPDGQPVLLDAAYWARAMTPVISLEGETPDTPPPSCAADADERLQYLFLSGFNQNIIDFMNQDASEILDSTDPIYPDDPESDESFFVRFANPRALITYVARSRSLETGNDYIGTCPYAFLIHVSSLHNEFLARDYEKETNELVTKVRALSARGDYVKAAEAFYEFRTSTYADYDQNRYPNMFRYDTEGKVFETMERLRGTARKHAVLEKLMLNAESVTRDAEARQREAEARRQEEAEALAAKQREDEAKKREVIKEQRDQDEKAFSALLGALGVFGLFQLMFQMSDVLQKDHCALNQSCATPMLLASDVVSLVTFVASVFAAVTFGVLAVRFVFRKRGK